MSKTPREIIPFFNDLPTKAFPAADRLWDAALRPDYSGPVAYRDFVQDLRFQGLSAPARALVNRWVAGVQAGMIERPSGAAEQTPASEPVETVAVSEQLASWSYFDMLPATATPALQAAWDRASVDGFTDAFILASFCRELAAIGHAEPAKVEFSQWLKAVRSNQIPRPGKPAQDKAARLEDAFEKLTPTTFAGSAFDTLREVGVVPASPPTTPIQFLEGMKPDPTLVMIRDRMVEEMVAHLSASVRATAEATVAARFRQIASTLEAAAS